MTDRPRRRRQPSLRVDPELPDDDHPELRTDHPVAAGHVLVVMVLALVLGALLNADRMVERAEQKPFDDRWRGPSLALWGALETVADATRLTAPRDLVESAIGRDDDGRGALDVGELLAEQRRPQEEGPATTTTTAPPAPRLRTPTAEQPLRVYVGGDSMSKNLGLAMQRVASDTGIIAPTIDFRLVSGLARPDFFNWPQHLADEVVPTDPEVVVLLFGANDAQGLQLADGTVCRRFEQCWVDEYRRRVAGTMDLLRDPDGDRIVLWLGQPIMGPATGVDHVDLFNAIYADEAADRPWVRYVDTWSWFSRADGSYAAHLPAADGSEHRVRDADDVHLSLEGGTRLSWALVALLGEELADLSAWPGQPPASALPPAQPAPRPSLPEPEPRLID